MKKEAIDTSSLAHTKWNCKYHIVFAPKYRRKTAGNKRNYATIMPMERSGDNRGRSMPRPYIYVGEHPAQNEHFGVHGVFKRQKCTNDLSKMGKHEVCIPKPRVLVQGILRRYRGKEHKSD